MKWKIVSSASFTYSNTQFFQEFISLLSFAVYQVFKRYVSNFQSIVCHFNSNQRHFYVLFAVETVFYQEFCYWKSSIELNELRLNVFAVSNFELPTQFILVEKKTVFLFASSMINWLTYDFYHFSPKNQVKLQISWKDRKICIWGLHAPSSTLIQLNHFSWKIHVIL